MTTVISDRWFRGALVVLVDRSRDPVDLPFVDETFLDGLMTGLTFLEQVRS